MTEENDISEATIKLDASKKREAITPTMKLKAVEPMREPAVIVRTGGPVELRFSVEAIVELLLKGVRMDSAERKQHIQVFAAHAAELARDARQAKDPAVQRDLNRQAMECAAIGRLFQCFEIGGAE